LNLASMLVAKVEESLKTIETAELGLILHFAPQINEYNNY